MVNDETIGHEDSLIDEAAGKFKFHLIKGNYFRVIHVDTATAQITPDLNVQVTVFSQRQPIPDQITHYVTPDGRLGDVVPEETISREGIVREVEASLWMTENTLRGMIAIFQRTLEQIQTAKDNTLFSDADIKSEEGG